MQKASRFRFRAAVCGALLLAVPESGAEDRAVAATLTELARGTLRSVAEASLIVDAVLAQNSVTADYDEARIDELDSRWRAQVGSDSRPFIQDVLASEASKYLAEVQRQSGGLISELFVMDARGLNVAISTVTSDYWQGDEDKFRLSFGGGVDAVHLGNIEHDASTGTLQGQVSIAILHPATGAAIGAVTAGLDLSALAASPAPR